MDIPHLIAFLLCVAVFWPIGLHDSADHDRLRELDEFMGLRTR